MTLRRRDSPRVVILRASLFRRGGPLHLFAFYSLLFALSPLLLALSFSRRTKTASPVVSRRTMLVLVAVLVRLQTSGFRLQAPSTKNQERLFALNSQLSVLSFCPNIFLPLRPRAQAPAWARTARRLLPAAARSPLFPFHTLGSHCALQGTAGDSGSTMGSTNNRVFGFLDLGSGMR
jgi:hypothetical protein